MGDGASCSRSNNDSNSSGGCVGGRGETVVIDHGRRRTSCGYCRSTGYTSISHGLWANSITADDYQELLDRGWRRSGCFLYKPDMERTCCPSYTIRLKASDFILSKEQVRVRKKMQRFLDGVVDMKKPDRSKDKPNSSMGTFNLTGNESLAAVSASSGKESPDDICEKMCKEDEFILLLSNKIDDAVRSWFGIGEFPTTTQLPKAVVKRVTPQVKKKLMETSEDLLYTSSICFRIAAVVRHLKSIDKNITDTSLSSDAELAESPKVIAEKLACLMKQHGELSDVLSKACNGHLNFYSTTQKTSELTSDAHKQAPKIGGNSKRSSTDSTKVLPYKRRKLEIRLKRSSFDPEEFELYRRYQIKVHDDKPEKVTEGSYRRFLVDTPIVFIPPCSGDKTVPAYGYGSFHQQYVIDGKLIAVGVVDILPRCLSSKYLFWDPDFAFLSLGKYSALQEINWVKETQVHCPSIQYYYLGYYIHSCRKMRYKAAYRPSELLCPLRYEWVPFDIARPLLDKKSYVVLSNFVALQDQPTPPQDPDSITRQLDSCPDHDGSGEACSDEHEITDLDFEDSDTGLDDESGSEAISASVTGDSRAPDVGNIVIDLNGSHVKFKVNTRQQTERDPSESSARDGTIRQMYQVVKQEGWERLYGGLAPSLVGTAASQGVYYYFYQIFRNRAETAAHDRWKKGIGDGSVGMFESLVVAALSGCVNVLLTNPIWVVVTRMQTHKKTDKIQVTRALPCIPDEGIQASIIEHPSYRTSHVVQELYDEAGLGGFWKGVVPTLIMVSNPSIQFMLYETLLKKMKIKRASNGKGADGFTALEIFLFGAVAKLGATVVTYPLLVVKSRLQVKQGHDDDKRHQYRGTFDAITKMIRYEGLSGFYKGMSTKVVQSVFAAAVLFMVKEELVKAARFLVTGKLRSISNSRSKARS